jgi:hypothetical protein
LFFRWFVHNKDFRKRIQQFDCEHDSTKAFRLAMTKYPSGKISSLVRSFSKIELHPEDNGFELFTGICYTISFFGRGFLL